MPRPKVAVVTGGSRGIGFAICERLCAAGTRVAVGASTEEAAVAAAGRLRTAGGEAVPFWGDVSVEGVAESAIETAVGSWGGLDIWINNAAIIGVSAIADETAEQWDRMMAVNLRGTFLGCRAAARVLTEQGTGGRILNASSVSGRRGGPLTGTYAAGKAGVIALTQSLAAELGAHAITVNVYCPGNVTSTSMWETVDRRISEIDGSPAGTAMAESVAGQAIARSGTEQEVAALVHFLASDEASFITGSCYVIDGGALRG